MSKIRVVIIEDEIPSARLLHSMVARLRPQWEIIVLPGNIEQAVEWFAANAHPDLIFLDIQLSDGVSFDFISIAKPSSTIIFTTAYDQYAIRAFSVNSIDYILKPVDENRLVEAITKYEKLTAQQRNDISGYLENVLETLQQRDKKFRTRFLIAGSDHYRTLQVADIAYFYCENKITYAVANDGKEYPVDMVLDKISDQLDPDLFFRANRQVLLSINSIRRIEPYFNGKVIVHTKPSNKDKITISKEKMPLLKLWLNF